MPTYDYRCDHCGHAFSAQRRYDELAVSECPKCGKPPRKLVSSPAIVFKGSGWHINDYRKGGDGAAEGGSAKSKDSDGGAKSGAAPAEGAGEAAKDAPASDKSGKDKSDRKSATPKKEGAPAKADDSSGTAAGS